MDGWAGGRGVVENLLDHLKPVGHDVHGLRTIGWIQLDAVHDLLRQKRMDSRILFVGWLRQTDFMVLSHAGCISGITGGWGQCGGHDLAYKHPVHQSTQIVDVSLGRDFTTTSLFRRDVSGCSLDPRLHGADRTRLAQIDDLDAQVVENQHVRGLDVRMDETPTMHVHQALCNLMEDVDDVGIVLWNSLVEGGRIDEFHDQ